MIFTGSESHRAHRSELTSEPTLRFSLELPRDPKAVACKIREVVREESLTIGDRIQYLTLIYSRGAHKEDQKAVAGIHILKALRDLSELNRPTRFDNAYQNLLNQVASHFCENPRAYNARNIADISGDFSHIGYRNIEFFKVALSRLKEETARAETLDFGRVLYASAHLDIDNRSLQEHTLKVLTKSKRVSVSWSELDDITTAQVAWSIAKFRPERLAQVVREEDLDREMAEKNWTLIYQSLVVSGAIRPGGERYNQTLKALLNQAIPNSNSRFERSVGETLKHHCASRGYELIEQPLFGFVAADYAFTTPEAKLIVVECDGDLFHSSIGPDGKRLLGRDNFQDSLFRAHGVDRIIHIWSEDWDEQPSRAPHFLAEQLGSI